MHANGIGDALLGLVAVTARHAQGRERVIYGCRNQEWVKLWMGYDDLGDVGAGININAGYEEECSTKAAMPRWERYAKNCNVKAMQPELRERAKLLDLGAKWKGFVALAPFSIYRNRSWSVLHWQSAENVLHAAGYKTVILHNNLADANQFAGAKLVSQPPETVTACILNCAALVGVDSGLAHVSNLVGTPTVVLSGPTDAAKVFFNPVHEIKGHLWCQGCFWQLPYSGLCDQTGCSSLKTIQPREVVEAVDAAVLPTLTAGRSLLAPKKLAVIRDAVLKTNDLGGDVAEMGVYKGGTAALIANYAGCPVHVFDTFAGQPYDDQAGGGLNKGFLSHDISETDVRTFLGERAVFHVGIFPETADPSMSLRFCHVDMDSYQATKAADEYLTARMVKGGMAVFV